MYLLGGKLYQTYYLNFAHNLFMNCSGCGLAELIINLIKYSYKSSKHALNRVFPGNHIIS